MKRLPLLFLLLGATCLVGCGKKTSETEATVVDSTLAYPSPTKTLSVAEGDFQHDYIVADQADSSHIYKADVNKKNTFFVIAKGDYRLYVYEAVAGDTLLAATFPVCYALNTEQKTREGDNCTPECDMKHPFHVSEVKDATTWCFNFNDGRGDVKAFGSWFIRLDLSKSFPDNESVAKNRSVGIHGSTNNERSVPGRDSHGCIRLRDADLEYLHDHYVSEGMAVVVRPLKEPKWGFEVKAEKALGDQYVAPVLGNPHLKNQPKPAATADKQDTTKAGKMTAAKAAPKSDGKHVTVTGDGVRLRYEPNTHCRVYTEVSTGTQLELLGKEDGWYKIRYDGKELYISADYAQ